MTESKMLAKKIFTKFPEQLIYKESINVTKQWEHLSYDRLLN